MAVALYMDVHVPWPITDQLRRRGVDVLTATEDGARELPDDALLQRATDLGRVVFTQDIRFKALAAQWQRQNRPFAGLLFGHQLDGTIGQYVKNLELIGLASEADEWQNTVGHLPF
jgi:hypothetical protein